MNQRLNVISVSLPVILFVLTFTYPERASAEEAVARDAGVGRTVSNYIEQYISDTGEDIVFSAKKSADVQFFGPAPEKMDYPALLTVLGASGLTAYRNGSYIHIISSEDAKFHPIPVVEEGAQYAPDEYVTKAIAFEKICATHFVAILRPLVPKFGHMAAHFSTNTLFLTDRFANIQRIEQIVSEVESRQTSSDKCSPPKVIKK